MARTASPALHVGTQRLLATPDGVLAWERTEGDDRRVVAVYEPERPLSQFVAERLTGLFNRLCPQQETAGGEPYPREALLAAAQAVLGIEHPIIQGGMGVARQLKDEVFNCPPVLLITARTSDNWLATWSKAEATVMHPIDPFTIAAKCASLLKTHSALAK